MASFVFPLPLEFPSIRLAFQPSILAPAFMAGFKTHVTFSSAIGCGYAVVGSGMEFDLSTSLVAGGLCGVAGMLPDVDSDSGVPRREALGFAAAIVPMLLVSRFRQFDLSHDQMVLAAALLYFGIRFTAANLIGRWSVHRGMWHSIPAILIFAGLAFLISGGDDIFARYLKAAAVALGSFSHLLLDEIYSVDTTGVVPRFKKSFGTAIKMWGKNPWANFSVYAKLALVAAAIMLEPAVLQRIELRNPQLADRLNNYAERMRETKDRFAMHSQEDNNQSAPPARAIMPMMAPQAPSPQNIVQPTVPRLQQAPQQPSNFRPAPINPPASGGFLPNRSGGYRLPPNAPPARTGNPQYR